MVKKVLLNLSPVPVHIVFRMAVFFLCPDNKGGGGEGGGVNGILEISGFK